MSRRRSQAQVLPVQTISEDEHDDMDSQPDSSSEKERAEKEQAVWDAFREEHFEAIDTMPLTLHRQLNLMRELDEQCSGYLSDLLPTLKQYIWKRKQLVTTPLMPQVEPLDADNLPQPVARTPLARIRSEYASTPRTPTPMGLPSDRLKAPETLRELLSHAAWLSEELIRASDEKVNLAKATQDSVDRHIRQIDQAIKEQEAAIALGTRSGTHLAPILLPDVVVPRYTRPPKAPQNVTILEMEGADDGELGVGAATLGLSRESTQSARSRRKPIKKTPLRNALSSEAQLDESLGQRRETRSLRLLPPRSSGGAGATDGGTAEPELYCLCRRPFMGEMIGCDNEKKCAIEWYHLECVQLTQAPEGSWFCPDCTAKNAKKGRKRR